MFDLEKAIQAYCQSVYGKNAAHSEQCAELQDHLYSAVEQFQQQGLSQEAAFIKAKKHLGSAKALKKEHAKNINPKHLGKLQIISALIFALAIMLSSAFIQDKDAATMVYFGLLALWWIPFSYLSSLSGKSVACEYRYFKRKLAGLFQR